MQKFSYQTVALEPVLLEQPRLPVLFGRVEENGSVVLADFLPFEDIFDGLHEGKEKW